MVVLRRRRYQNKVNLTTAGQKNLIFLPRSHVNNALTFCNVCRTDFNIGHGGKNDISQHIKSQRYIRTAEAQKGNT